MEDMNADDNDEDEHHELVAVVNNNEQLQRVIRDDAGGDGDDDDDDGDDGEEEEEETEEGSGGDDDDDDEVTDSSSEEEEVEPIPTPEEVELEYTYPQDFQGRRSWEDVIRRDIVTGDYHYFRVILDPSCIDIRPYFFRGCMFLIEIVCLDGTALIRIGAWAFDRCIHLQRIRLPEGLKFIEAHAFETCSSLEEIAIPSTVILVGLECFARSKSLRRVVFDEPLSPSSAADATAVEIRSFVFWYCENLQSVKLPRNMTSIPECCFLRCRSLIDVPVPVAVRAILRGSFRDCTSLASIDLSKNIDLIETTAYLGCSSLQSVTLRSSSSNLRIGGGIFHDCPALSSITVFPSVWPQLFQSMNREIHPIFIYKFLRNYQYQMDRLVQWKKSADGTISMPPVTSHGDLTIAMRREN